MLKVKSWMKSATVITFLFASMMSLTACNEVHPDNQPGATNNPYPELSIAATSTVSIDAADASMVYSIPVNLSVAAPENGQVNFRLISGTAIQGRDYEASSGSVAFNKGDRQANIEITLLNDAMRSQARDFRIELIPSTNAKLGSAINHKVTIHPSSDTSLPPEAFPELSVSSNSSVKIDPADNIMLYSVPVVFSTTAPKNGTLTFRVVPGTAKEGRDYSILTENISFNAGSRQASLEIMLLNDAGRSQDRELRLEITGASNANLSANISHIVTIEAFDSTIPPPSIYPEISISTASTVTIDPSDNSMRYSVPVVFSKSAAESGQITFRAIPDTAKEGRDYQPVTGVVTFNEGSRQANLEVTVLNDPSRTQSRSFRLEITGATKANLSSAVAHTITLTPYANPYPELSMIGSATVTIDPADTTMLYSVPVSFSKAAPESGQIIFHAVSDTAKEGRDYQPVIGTVSFVAGARQANLEVTLLNDAQRNEARSFRLELVSANNANLGQTLTHTITLSPYANPYPELSMAANATITIDPADTTMLYSVPVSFSKAAPESGQIIFHAVSDTAKEGRDYDPVAGVINFAAGAQLANMEVILKNDTGRSEARSFRLELLSANNANLGITQIHTVTLAAYNNPYPELSMAASATVNIDPADTSMVYSVPVTFSKPAPENGQFEFKAIPETAKLGRDYMAAAGTVNFIAGSHQANVEVTLLNDATRSEARNFRLLITKATHAMLSSATHQTITIAALSEEGAPSVLALPTNLTFMAPTTGEENYSIVLPLSSRLQKNASVQIRSVSGTAREGVHYKEITGAGCVGGTCTLQQGAAELVFELPIIGQAASESRTFQLQFLAAQDMELSSVREIEVTLNYTEEAVFPELNAPSALTLRMPLIERGTVKYPIIITLSDMLQHSAKLQWRTVDDSAVAGIHYTAVDATGANEVTLNPGQSTFEFELELLHDLATNEDVSFQLQLVSAEGITLPANRTITVDVIHSNEDNSAYPRVSFPDTFTLQEPTIGSDDFNLYLTLSEALPEDAELSFQFVSGTAELGVDFEVLKDTLYVNKGSNRIAVPVRINENPAKTTAIQFQVQLNHPLNLALPTKRSFNVRIVDESEAPTAPHLTLTPNLIRVPVARGTTPEQMTLYFPLSGKLADAAGATVIVESRNGSAGAGVEFVEITPRIKAMAQNATQLNVDITLLPQILDEPREFELMFSGANGVQLPENRVVTVQIEPRETPELPTLTPPEERIVFRAPQDINANKQRKIVLPFDGVAPLAGRVTVFVEEQTGRESIDFVITNKSPMFNIGEQEVVIELEVEPVGSTRTFRVILESAENVSLPSEFESRIINVTINPY